MTEHNNYKTFLKSITHRTVSIAEETVELFRLGTFENGEVWELVGFAPGLYRPHIHDKTWSRFYFVYGKGYLLIENRKVSYLANTHIDIKADQSHGFEVEKETLLLSIQDRAILNEKQEP